MLRQAAVSIAGPGFGKRGAAPGAGGSLQQRRVRVTVKYDGLELQLSLEVEKWIVGRLEELGLHPGAAGEAPRPPQAANFPPAQLLRWQQPEPLQDRARKAPP
ncbi:hypothetical protein CapIbe_000701 [Capra ibex]